MAKAILTSDEFERQSAALGYTFPMASTYEPLFTPFPIGHRTAANRIVYQPMEGCDGEANGAPSELTRAKYIGFAEAGPGVIWMEATAVCDEGKANPRQLRLTEETKSEFARLVSDMKRVAREKCGIEPLLILQLTHSGRQSKPHGKPAQLVAYHNAIFEEHTVITDDQIVTDDYLDRLQDAFVDAAKLAVECGFDGVDIKSCHGYLLGELMSGYHRPGKYGGCYENRMRFLKETVARVRAAVPPETLVCSRLSAYDGFPYPWGFGVHEGGGITPDLTEIYRLVSELKAEGTDFIDITMGNPYVNPHVNRPFVQGGYTPEEEPLTGVHRMLEGTVSIREQVPGIAIVASGMSYLGAVAPSVAAGYVESGKLDLVGFGRMTLAYPDFIRDLAAGKFQKNKICLACSQCTRLMRCGGTAGCVVRNPYYQEEYQTMKKEGKIV